MKLTDNADATLLHLVRERLKSTDLLDIARAAGVSYTSLWKWTSGRQRTLNLLDAERVFYLLTGKKLIPEMRVTITPSLTNLSPDIAEAVQSAAVKGGNDE